MSVRQIVLPCRPLSRSDEGSLGEWSEGRNAITYVFSRHDATSMAQRGQQAFSRSREKEGPAAKRREDEGLLPS